MKMETENGYKVEWETSYECSELNCIECPFFKRDDKEKVIYACSCTCHLEEVMIEEDDLP
jgi:hypothetical protein